MESFSYSEFTNDAAYSKDYSIAAALYQGWTTATLIVSGIGFVSNTLIIIVILHGSLRASVFMSLLMFLAITDNVVLLFTVALRTRDTFHIFVSSLLFCRIISLMYITAGIISVWLLVFISLERFIAVFFPLKVNIYCTMKRTYILISVLTILGFVSAAPLLFTGTSKNVDGRISCSMTGSDPVYDLIYLITLHLVYSTIPFVIIATLNMLLVRKIKVMRKLRQRLIGQPHAQSNTNNQRSPLPMMFSICVLFAVTSFPTTTYLFIRTLCRIMKGKPYFAHDNLFFLIQRILDEMNHCLNLFLYCLTGSVFRKTLFNLFRCKR